VGEQAIAAAPEAERPVQKTSYEELLHAIRSAAGELAAAEAELRGLDAHIEASIELNFDDERDRYFHTLLRGQLAELKRFAAETMPSVRKRLDWTRLDERSATEHGDAWASAREAIRRADGNGASRLYGKAPTDLHPQVGLVPIGKNPVTGLLEFYHLRSAADPTKIPVHRPDGSLDVDEDSGIVFVLVPGGTFSMGAQGTDPGKPNFDRRAETAESDVHEVALAPFFLARFELTQGQWRRLTLGENPSYYADGSAPGNIRSITALNPVENISWDDCTRWLSRHGLLLPTEAQWEYACRAGTTTPWSCGDRPESLEHHANLADQTAVRQPWRCEAWDDGNIVHAPVGSFAPNPFGLHDVHGNVWEWVRDVLFAYAEPVRAGDGLRGDEDAFGARVYRGGGFSDPAYKLRSSNRDGYMPSLRSPLVGVRAARALH